MNKLFSLIFALCLLAAFSFAQRKESPKNWPIVHISFEKFGKAINPMEEHLAERDDRSRSNENGKDIWLRLHNNSKWAIFFATDSMYLGKRVSSYQLPDGKSAFGLADGIEVSMQYQLQEQDGRRVSSNSDNSFTSCLPPGRSVLFSVRREYLSNGRMIFVNFNYDWEQGDVYSNNLAPVHRSEYYSYRLERRVRVNAHRRTMGSTGAAQANFV